MTIKVFVLHGMGSHSKDWWSNPTTGVGEDVMALKRYNNHTASIGNTGTLKDFCSDLDFIDIHYDEINESLYNAMNDVDSVDSLIETIKADPSSNVTTTQLEAWKPEAKQRFQSFNPFNANDFLRDNVWDIFLCSMALTRHYLAAHVAEQIIKFNAENPEMEWAILAHSLGAALIRDVMDYIFQEANAGRVNFKPARCVACVCDFGVMKISADGYSHFLTTNDPISIGKTSVWPATTSARNYSMSSANLHARHKFDPLSYLCADMPVDMFGNGDERFNGNRMHVLGHNTLKNLPHELPADPIDLASFLHSIPNYMANPEFHMRFFGYVLRDKRFLKSTSIVNAQKQFEIKMLDEFAGDFAALLPASATSQLGWLKALAKKLPRRI